jgi:hypothetical protein
MQVAAKAPWEVMCHDGERKQASICAAMSVI